MSVDVGDDTTSVIVRMRYTLSHDINVDHNTRPEGVEESGG